MSATEVSKFYRYSINLVYAVIVALSFDVATELFIPIQNIWESYANFTNAMALILAYVVIICGWVGWTKSMIDKPHKVNFYGNSRFVLDLLIGFWSFYLIQLAKPENFGEYSQVFIWVFPAIFVTYLVWDLAKFKEYNMKNETKVIQENRLVKTLYGLAIFFVISIVYYRLFQNGITLIFDGYDFTNLVFIWICIIFTLLYRKSKWKQKKKPKKISEARTNTN